MFSKSNNTKVKFQDQELDDYVLENSVLKSKLQSKIAALSIMSKELDKCCMERDRYKVLVDQLNNKNRVPYQSPKNTNLFKLTHNNAISGGQLLATTREQNNMLKVEVESLRSKLEDATGDITALRKQLQLMENCNGINKLGPILTYSNKDYEELVQELEKIHKKYQQLQLDYRATLDEKEEIIQDRDYYKSKVQRLNQQISYIITSRSKNNDQSNLPKPIVDLDALVTEKKYLHESITQLQVEKEIMKRTLTKYKTLLENRNKNDSLNLKKGFLDVMTQKQVREYLENNSKTGLKRTSASELKSLCLGLFEAVNDKSIALQHQRKTNQILANRIAELEKTLESWCEGQKCVPIFPSQMLLEEFLPDNEPESMGDKVKKDDSYNASQDSDDDSSSKGNSDSTSECGYDSSKVDRVVLPKELEELVKEALAEIKTYE